MLLPWINLHLFQEHKMEQEINLTLLQALPEQGLKTSDRRLKTYLEM